MRNTKGIITRLLVAVLVFSAVCLLKIDYISAAIPPIGTANQTVTYPALENPVLSDDPALARPIGIGKLATGGDELDINVVFNKFSEDVDIYFGFGIQGKVYYYKNKNLTELTDNSTLSEMVWKSQPAGQGLYESILQLKKADIDSLKQTITAPITLAVLVIKLGATDKYYLWDTTFSLAPPTLTVSKSGDGSGKVTSSPSGIDCGSDCNKQYASGTTVTLTAAADTGATFTGWSADCSGIYITCDVTMNASKAVTATFTKETTGKKTLTVTKSGTGSGAVTSSPSGIDCGSTCSSSFTTDQSVTLTATALSGSTFSSDTWSGCDSKIGAQCTVTMSSSKAVIATFNSTTGTPACVTSISPPEKLDFTVSGGAANVTVTAPLDCKWTATTTNTWITITSGSSGAGNGTVTYSVAANTGANELNGVIYIGSNNEKQFTVKQSGTGAPSTTYTLTVTKPGTGRGIVTASSGTISWNGNTGTATYTGSTAVTLTAVAASANLLVSGSTFGGWSGCDSTSVTTCTVTMSSAKTVTATFTGSSTGSTACVTSITPPTMNFPAAGGSGTITVNAPSTCTWTASQGMDTWITIAAGSSGTVSGTVSYSVAANTGSLRSGNITIGDQRFTVTQDAAAATPKKLTVTTNSGTGGGTVTSSPAGINCGTTCSYIFPVGTATVTLAAVADANSTFISWSGGCTGTASTCNVTMDTDKTVYATFNKAEPTLTVMKTGTGSGNVTLSTGTINWSGNTGTAIYTDMTTVDVTLTAAANSNSDFKGWGGGCAASGVSNTCTVTVKTKEPKNVTAEFASCVSIAPASQNMGISGGAGNVITVTTTSSNCSWTAASAASWITIKTGSSGAGNGTIAYDVAPNSGTSRTGTININEQTFTVSQTGSAVSAVTYIDTDLYKEATGNGITITKDYVSVQAIYWQDTQKTNPKIDPAVKYPNYGRYAKFYKYTVPAACSTKWGPMIGGNISAPISENMIVSNRDFMTEEKAWNLYLGVNSANADGSAGPGYNTLGYGFCREGVGKNGDCKTPTSTGSTMLTDVYSYYSTNYAKPVGTDGQKIWHKFSSDYETEGVNIDFQRDAVTERTFYIMITCEDNTASQRLYPQCIFRLQLTCD